MPALEAFEEAQFRMPDVKFPVECATDGRGVALEGGFKCLQMRLSEIAIDMMEEEEIAGGVTCGGGELVAASGTVRRDNPYFWE